MVLELEVKKPTRGIAEVCIKKKQTFSFVVHLIAYSNSFQWMSYWSDLVQNKQISLVDLSKKLEKFPLQKLLICA